jgi:ABC-type antimicrobial peptide transport system permease subunit
MKQIFLGFVLITLFFSCSNTAKELNGIKKGMTKEQVLSYGGEPTSRNNLNIADLWVYEDADRTVVFRDDTVFNIITTANARIDSIELSLKKAGYKLENQFISAKDSLQNAGQGIKRNLNSAVDSIDSVAKKLKSNLKKKIKTD